jgi:23S rRNA pseudouridine955/2504/2580 synthase/23S rRNA pseudouridine1911/1915/1917 synthase
MSLTSFTIRDAERRKLKIEILFENQNFLVINKPAGLRVIPDRWIPSLPNLKDILQNRLQKSDAQPSKEIYIIHRIDFETSGLVLIALTKNMHRLMNELFLKKQIEKTYLAIVHGHPSEVEGTIDLPIQENTSKKTMQIDKRGQASLTKYKLLEKYCHFSLLEVKPKTGRTHQIRIHLREIGCPLAIDTLYGKPATEINISHLKRNVRIKQNEMPHPLIKRLTLHAAKIAFKDPLTGKNHSFEAPLPKDFWGLLKALHKYNSVPGTKPL